jgi:hypothetical protein
MFADPSAFYLLDIFFCVSIVVSFFAFSGVEMGEVREQFTSFRQQNTAEFLPGRGGEDG